MTFKILIFSLSIFRSGLNFFNEKAKYVPHLTVLNISVKILFLNLLYKTKLLEDRKGRPSNGKAILDFYNSNQLLPQV